jgi:transcriptional regulator with XRE-family HTH domain
VPIGGTEGDVSEETVSQRLRRIRIERGLSLEAIAGQHGLRVEYLQAIEQGRFGDLPSGIYGRSAVRRYSAVLGLSPDEVLASCAAALPRLEDPINALGRLRGLPRKAHEEPAPPLNSEKRLRTDDEEARIPSLAELPSWRLLAAAAVDALIAVALLILLVTCTVASGVPISGLGRTAAPAFALLTLLMASCYFIVLGGVIGTTIGELLVNPGAQMRTNHRPLDLSTVADRTMGCLLRDVYFIELLGKWIGRFIAHHRWPGGMNQASHAERPAA